VAVIWEVKIKVEMDDKEMIMLDDQALDKLFDDVDGAFEDIKPTLIERLCRRPGLQVCFEY